MIVTPGRIYEYFRLKKPILAICPFKSDLANLVKIHDAGETVSYNNVKGIQDILINWITNSENFSKNYSFSGLKQLSRKNQTRQFLNFLKGLEAELPKHRFK